MEGLVKIVITGNLGYVGPWATRQLRARYPHAVLAGIDTGFFAHCLTAAAHLPEALLDAQHFADIRHLPEHLLEGADAVVHLAAVSNDPIGHAYEDVTYDVNFKAGVELARRAKAAGAGAFVFASSCSVYGPADDRPRTETSEVQPLTAYARSKVMTEEGLRELAAPDFRVTCLRFATACGMSERLRLDLVLNDFVASAVSTGRITVLSDGTPWRPLIDVRDMARALEWGVGRSVSEGGPFLVVNAGSDAWNFQVRDLAEAVARAVPGTEVSINTDAPADKRSYRVSFALFRKLAPQHQPQADLPGTIEGLRQGLLAIGFADPDFRNSTWIRLRVLADLQQRGLLTPSLAWSHRGEKQASGLRPQASGLSESGSRLQAPGLQESGSSVQASRTVGIRLEASRLRPDADTPEA